MTRSSLDAVISIAPEPAITRPPGEPASDGAGGNPCPLETHGAPPASTFVPAGVALGDLPPSTVQALARAATTEGRALGESWVLCSLLLLVAIVCVAWSLPTPGASALLALLCLVLIAREHVRSRQRFRSAVARVGEAHGLSAKEAERAAKALAKAWDTASPGR
ncbi:hypothetical protein [Chondromyces crocatus]|nr:hypothetical protein [Chondromyces crocatus]